MVLTMSAIQTAIDNLKTAIAGLQSGEGPIPFINGHGLQSHRFRFEWRDEKLSAVLVSRLEEVFMEKASGGFSIIWP